ncbi:MAG: DNA polymerase III subunit [Acidobacteria bacterium]|nr:DNA polymerase III subunit [Acidobacteriota bacterium]
MPFRTIFGHRPLLHLISRSIARGTLPQSLIFAGPDGVGKKRTAIAVAQGFNCLRAVAGSQGSAAFALRATVSQGEASSQGSAAGDLPVDACGACPVCRRIERNMFPDVLLVEPEETGAIKIEQVRTVVGETAFRPFEGRRRVVIIDQADRMGEDAQDALLKSLEEPPPNSTFILVSARADSLAPTVRSRCSRLRFGRLSAAEIARALVRDHEYSEDKARELAALAGGSLGRALEADSGNLNEVRAACCRALQAVASAADARVRLDSVRELVGERKAGSTAGADREELAARLTALLSVVRDLAIFSTRANGNALANLDLTAELEGLSRFYGCDRAVRAFAAADRALRALRRNASPKIVADWLVLQL